MPSRTLLDTVRVAATFAGTIIGAGFASGQELVTFFVVYGSIGLAGTLLAGCLFAWLGSRTLELGHRLNATGYHQLIYHVCGKKAGFVLDMIIAAFLFSVLTIMLAGAGTVCRDSLNLPFTAGIGLLATVITFIALRGVAGITAANMITTPLLTAAIIAISIYSLSYHGFDTALLDISAELSARPAPHWLLSSILYVSYNLVMGTTVLAPLGAAVPSRRARLRGSISGGLLLAILASLVSMAVMLHCPGILDEEIPMLYISKSQHELHGTAYTVMFLIAMFTTALASLYGCASKLSSVSGLNFSWCVLIVTAFGLLFSQVGFSNLIGLLFPLFGYATLWFLIRLIMIKI